MWMRGIFAGAAPALLGANVLICALLAPTTVHPACNAVTAADQLFPSTLGESSTPIAQPGQEVVLSRETEAFSLNAIDNVVELTFRPPAGPETTLTVLAVDPAIGSRCDPTQCIGTACACVRFFMPNTDAYVGTPTDGQGLTGPVIITARTNGALTAQIDSFRIRDSSFRDDVFPSFVALPPANAYAAFAQGPGGEAFAAVDDLGNLFVPLDFNSLTPSNQPQAHFVSIATPGTPLALETLNFTAFTPTGSRLPPVLMGQGTGVMGTVDGPTSVIRVGQVPPGPLRLQSEGKGPVVIPGITGTTHPKRRGDIFTLQAGGRWSIYENRECGLQDPTADCVDLNGDGDQTDYFLFALDMNVPAGEPLVIDEIDATTLGGYPSGFALAPLYHFRSSNALVVFEIGESSGSDLNGDGDELDVLRSGAFDLTRGVRIELATGATRLEMDGSLLAYSYPLDPLDDRDELHFYDAAQAQPGPFVWVRNSGDRVYVHRVPVSDGLASRLTPLNTRAIDVAAGRIAFVGGEELQGADLDGNGVIGGNVVWVADVMARRLSIHSGAVPADLDVRITSSRVAWNTESLGGRSVASGGFLSSTVSSYCFRETDGHGHDGFLWGEAAGEWISCVVSERSLDGLRASDLNGDGDTEDYVLPAFGVALNIEPSPGYVPRLHYPETNGVYVATPVDESAQGEDLDGDPTTSGPILHLLRLPASVNGTIGPTINTRQRIAPTSPLQERFTLHFFENGLSFITDPLNQAVFLRDLDEDGAFEDSIGGQSLDNCPLVSNSQRDWDQDGIGDACDADAWACPSMPTGPCNAMPGQGSVRLTRDASTGDGKITLKWKGCDTLIDDLGNSASEGMPPYLVCAWDSTGKVMDIRTEPVASCGPAGCWRISPNGVKYGSKATGIQKLTATKSLNLLRRLSAKVRVPGLGSILPLLPSGFPFTVQVGLPHNACWRLNFSEDDVAVNTATQFKATEPALSPTHFCRTGL